MPIDEASKSQIRVTKLEAAKRQLTAAIRLFFDGGDEIAVHTLAVASYDILHTLSKRKGAHSLLFDTDMIRDEYRRAWVAKLKSQSNFFKHADRDPDGEIEFAPFMNEAFIAFAVSALSQMNEAPNMEMDAFRSWFEHVRGFSKKPLSADVTRELVALPKREFFESFAAIWRA
jgi:hypothetical protein